MTKQLQESEAAKLSELIERTRAGERLAVVLNDALTNR